MKKLIALLTKGKRLRMNVKMMNGHVHKYQTHFWGFVQTEPFLSF